MLDILDYHLVCAIAYELMIEGRISSNLLSLEISCLVTLVLDKPIFQ